MLAIGMAGFDPSDRLESTPWRGVVETCDGPGRPASGVFLHLSLETFGEFIGSQRWRCPAALRLDANCHGLSLWEGQRQRDDRWLFLFCGWAPTFGLMLALSWRQKSGQLGGARPISRRLSPPWPLCGIDGGRYGRGRAPAPGDRCRHGDDAGGDDRGAARSRSICPAGNAASADPLARLKGWQSLARAVETLAGQMPQAPFYSAILSESAVSWPSM